MASPLTSYFKSVSVSEHLATAFQQREPGQPSHPQAAQRLHICRTGCFSGTHVLGTEVIPEVRIPHRLVDVVAPYYTRELEYMYFDSRHHFRSQLHVAQYVLMIHTGTIPI